MGHLANSGFLSRGFVGRKTYTCSPKHLKTPFGYWLHFADSTVKCLKGCSPVELGISLRPFMILKACGLRIG